jgi:phosphate:Na+ symporter
MLIGVGLLMTAVMQSSTAAIAVTLSAHYAGAVGLDQACALIIGQNIGTATSSAMAAIGASGTAKRLALAYILFKLIAAVIAVVFFPVVTPLLIRASSTIDGVTLLAGYHTAYNVVGVAAVLPLISKFRRFVERILPERGSPLTRCLDSSALATPIVAVEAVRRTVARAVGALCNSLDASLTAASRGDTLRPGKDVIPFSEVTDALRQAQEFISGMNGPLESKDDQRRLTTTLHALDHASRLAEAAGEAGGFEIASGDPGGVRAVKLCAEEMRSTALIAGAITEPASAHGHAATPELLEPPSALSTNVILQLEHCAKELDDVQRSHRSATLSAAADGELTASEAMARVDAVRRLASLAHHAWRAAAHLTGSGPQRETGHADQSPQ